MKKKREKRKKYPRKKKKMETKISKGFDRNTSIEVRRIKKKRKKKHEKSEK